MAQKHTVRIWSTSHCPWCHKTKEWLKAHSIEYTDINVEHDQKAAAEMIEKSGQRGVPVIEIDGKKIIIGFNEPALKKALEIA
ncbi:MAG TPA: glutaredoxin family protein [Candidatus Nanoarchaeia archaeon]|nr:glutaredoxin family protein [Candidatus Nanoarchaeia archaeon]